MNDEATFLPGSDADDKTVFPNASNDDATVLPAPRDIVTAALPMPSAPSHGAAIRFEPGDTIFGGTYRVLEAVTGGMEADAYRGERVVDGAPVFIKHQKRSSSDARAWLLDKLTTAKHVGLLRLLHYELADRPIEIYEWLAGRSLATILRDGERYTDEQILDLATQLGEAVRYLHETVGVAHRDIKPDNILVVTDAAPRYVLVDYGIMTMVDSGGYTNFAGTRKYAAPESRMRGLERKDFLPYDWWSLGRVIQELADGAHPYDRIRSLFPQRERDSEAIAVEWDKILFEDDPSVYGRAGQVEHGSNERWKPLLRGLLTSDRTKRWSYDNFTRSLRGERLVDFYDSGSAQRTTSTMDSDIDLRREVERLSQEDHWDEAIEQILENRGIYRRAKNDVGNKRIIARLAVSDRVHAFLTKQSFSTATIEDLTTMLALKSIGGDAVQMSLSGFELSEDSLVARAANDDSASRDLFAALTEKDVADGLAELHEPSADVVKRFSARWVPVYRVLSKWDANAETLLMAPRMIRCAYTSRAENDALIAIAQTTLAYTTHAALQAAFMNAQRSDAEAAALAFLLPSAGNWRFVTKETVAKQKAETIAVRALSLKQAYAWMTVRANVARYGFLFGNTGPFALAGLSIIPTALFLKPAIALSLPISIAIMAGSIWVGSLIARKSQLIGGLMVISAIGSAVVAFGTLSSVEGIAFIPTLILGVIAYFTIRAFRNTWLGMLQAQLKDDTDGGWFKGCPDLKAIEGYISDFIPEQRLSFNDVQAELIRVNTEIEGFPTSWGFQSQKFGNYDRIDAERTKIFIATGTFSAIALVLGFIYGTTAFFIGVGHKVFGGH